MDEIKKGIMNLKNNKASGWDKILNEYIKSSSCKLMQPIHKLFNLVLATGKIPADWGVGSICPIYKGKGNKDNVDNYRGITLLSCFGKLFTSIINKRLYTFLDKNKLLGWEQGGFRQNSGTVDMIFSLHCLLDIYLQNKKKLFCTFVDYRKAFDYVQRNILWERLIKNGIGGNVLKVIKDLYIKAKSCVSNNGQKPTTFFYSNVGVKQGENLSPVLFSLFLNDLKSYMTSQGVKGITLSHTLAQEMNMRDIEHYVHLFLLLYADDTAILAETATEMQMALDSLKRYCDKSGLHLNVEKTKVLVFSRGKIRNLPNITYNNEKVEVVFEYKYLGTLFNYNNKFQKAIKHQYLSANRAMFSLLKKCRALDLPIDIQIDLFNKCIVPILLYGCEVWGYRDVVSVSHSVID